MRRGSASTSRAAGARSAAAEAALTPLTPLPGIQIAAQTLRTPSLEHDVRASLDRLVDQYSLFSLSWIEKHRGRSARAWLNKRAGPRFRTWSGLAFESICLEHVDAIKRALGIAAVDTEDAPWFHRSTGPGDDGAQIDLVIDRADRSINLCEMRFSESEFVIDKAYARELTRKRDVFRTITGTKKALFLTLITTHGTRTNDHAQRLGVQSVTMDALFRG